MPDADEDIIRLLSHHDRGIRAFVLAITGRADVVDDIVQDVAAVVWRRRADFDPERSFGAWARGIARMATMEALRKERRRPLALEHAALDAIESAFAQHDAGAHAANERLDALEHCRGRLSAAHRELLRQRYQNEWSDAQIAEETGRSEAAVTKALVRIRRALRQCIQSRLGVPS